MSANGTPAEPRDRETSGGSEGLRVRFGGKRAAGGTARARRELGDGLRVASSTFKAEKETLVPFFSPKKDAPVPKPQRHRGRGEAPEQGAIPQPTGATVWV